MLSEGRTGNWVFSPAAAHAALERGLDSTSKLNAKADANATIEKQKLKLKHFLTVRGLFACGLFAAVSLSAESARLPLLLRVSFTIAMDSFSAVRCRHRLTESYPTLRLQAYNRCHELS